MFFLDTHFYKNTTQLLIGLHEGCACVYGIVLMLCVRWPPLILRWCLTPLRVYALAFFVLTNIMPNHVPVHPYQYHMYLLLGRLVIPCPSLRL